MRGKDRQKSGGADEVRETVDPASEQTHPQPPEAEEWTMREFDDELLDELLDELFETQAAAPERPYPYIGPSTSNEDIKDALRIIRNLSPEQFEEDRKVAEKLIERAKRLGWKPSKAAGTDPAGTDPRD
jgi:hypothetical protein